MPLNLRRAALALAVAGLTAGAALTWWMRYRNLYRPVLERITLTVPAAHRGLAGLRIGFVTDTHINPYFRRADLQRGVDLIAAERPDLVLLGGDYISETTRYIDEAAPVLGTLARGAPLGGVAVLGNHDLGGHGSAVVAALEAEGIRVLRNEVASIAWNGDALWVVGIDDTLLGQPEPATAFGRIPDGAAALCLWHEPDAADIATRFGPFAQISGHSHGGQIRLPILGELAVPIGGRRYPIGHYDVDGMQLYVSRGLGTYRPPVRFRCAPEVTLITLVAEP
jgi:predicted MPP superfamily phosphohydrolase